jgi:DNA-binding beta-propeller fold protein YncE
MKSKNILYGLSMSVVLPFAVLALVTPLRADNPPTYLFQIGSPADHVALDSSNNVYLSYEGSTIPGSSIWKFSASGTYLAQWGSYGSGNGQFADPEGIAVDSSNNVYVVDYGNYRIEKFSSSGRYLTQWGSGGSGNGQFSGPEGIAVDSGNNVYVADTLNDRVEKFTSNGNYLTQWGSSGRGNGQFIGPFGIAVDSGNNVYVVDSGNSRIEKFDSSGNYQTQWGSYGANNGQFDRPLSVAVDSSNNVYVADTYNDRVEKFSSSGNYLTQWGGNGRFVDPDAVAVDSSGNFIYVGDNANSVVLVFVDNTNIIPPFIEQQPTTNQFVAAGINVTFSVGVLGAEPFSYQWNSNNVAVPGATNATFTLTNVNLSASGNYSALVTNSYGSVLSGNADLTVLPALVTTQPASGRSATGATLNGSVTVGPDETVAWFDWGTDTSYGNITGAIIVPGNNGSSNINAPLNGLPGNFYHYRTEASNDFGIVYGEDQSFTVGFAPSVTTLPPTNGANGVTLAAAVNPEGWDTTVYFQWQTPTLTNTTPGIKIGASATSSDVSSFVPGLASSIPYQYQVVASNALGTTIGAVAYGDPDRHPYLFSGSETNITLAAGAYIITAYGAPGGGLYDGAFGGSYGAGLGAEMSAEFNFSTPTTLTLLVGGGGGVTEIFETGGGGGGGSFVVEGSTPLVIAGGGGGAGEDQPGADGSNGTYSANGQGGGPYLSGAYRPDGGAGGANGGGGAGGTNFVIYGSYGGPSAIAGSGGGGFFGNGGNGITSSYGYNGSTGGGGYSFETGGYGGFSGGGNSGYGYGGYGGGGGGADAYADEGGGGGGGGGYSGGGGGGIQSSGDAYGGGGGGGSIIDASAITILAEVSGIASPDDSTNGEIIITAVPPSALAPGISTYAAPGFTGGAFGFDVSGPPGSNVVIQASTDLQTWIPLQTNLLGSWPLYFSDTNAPANVHRFYRLSSQ